MTHRLIGLIATIAAATVALLSGQTPPGQTPPTFRNAVEAVMGDGIAFDIVGDVVSIRSDQVGASPAPHADAMAGVAEGHHAIGGHANSIALQYIAASASIPRILAVVYFHSNSEHDWTLDDEPDALAAFRRMARDPYFNPPRL